MFGKKNTDRVLNRVIKHFHFRLCLSLILALFYFPPPGFSQTIPIDKVTTNETPATVQPIVDNQQETPLTNKERAELLELIRSLQERVEKLEAAQGQKQSATTTAETSPANNPSEATPNLNLVDVAVKEVAHPPVLPTEITNKAKPTEEKKWYGRYTPNLGFKVADTEQGDLSVSIYTYCRYLNQLGLDSTYQDAFGNIKTVKNRQDFQINKVQIKFLGWIMDPKFRYFLYAWTSNATQGQGAQVVLAGNLSYNFNKYVTLALGITSLPGVRSTEGNFPFWLGVDSRMIADEFFRPSYTSGIWVKGDLTNSLRYQAMLGNNMSTLGVSAARLDNKFNTFSSELVWEPTGDYGMGFGDFEDHDRVGTRLAAHFTRSDEDKESQPNSEVFENTQIRLSDGTVIFTPNLFGPGITIDVVRYRMVSLDGGIKYRGLALESEYYFRRLDKFRGSNTAGLPSIFDHGFQAQFSAMAIPKTLQVYTGYSKIFGEFGNPFDFRLGLNWFPWKNKVIRWNNEWLYLRNSPVGYTSVPFALGGRGSVYHSTLEMAF